MDNNSLGSGLMAVFAVSGSVALLAMQVHKRLLSDFLKKIEFEMGSKKNERQKKVRFNHKAEAKKNDLKSLASTSRSVEETFETLPLNWQALYKGIIEDRVVKGLY